MPDPRALAALLLLAGALAGCTAPAGGPGQEEAPAPAPAGPQEGLVPTQEAANATQPDDRSEFARTLDERFHTHNYWGGALEKTLLDADVAAGPALRQNEFGPIGTVFESAFFVLGFGGVGTQVVELPEGSIVPPEADRLEVRVTWASSPSITGVRLGYRTAAGGDLAWLEPFPEGGGSAVLATSLEHNDIPHTTQSKWRFILAPHHPAGAPGVFNGTVHMTVKVFRPDVLLVAPPHPDFWGDNTTLALGSNATPLRGTRAIVPVAVPQEQPSEDSGFAIVQMPPGSIVPSHTGLLTVTLEWQNNASVPDPLRIRPGLVYSAANSPRPFPAPLASEEPGRAVYHIPVDAKTADSPYAEESQWRFFVYLRSDPPGDQPFGFGSVGRFEGHVTLAWAAERQVA